MIARNHPDWSSIMFRHDYSSALTDSTAVAMKIAKEAALMNLRGLAPGVVLTTSQLANSLWPAKETHGPELVVRKRFVDDLLRLARGELNGLCAQKGQAVSHRKFMGRAVVPWVWYRPADAKPADTAKLRQDILDILCLTGSGFSLDDAADEIMKLVAK